MRKIIMMLEQTTESEWSAFVAGFTTAVFIMAIVVALAGCRVPGADQHENNHKIIQTWDKAQ